MRRPADPRATGPVGFGVRPVMGPGTGGTACVEQLAQHFICLGRAPGGQQRLVQSSDAVVTTLRKALDAGRMQPALDLVRIAAPAFALAARWGAWASTLEIGLQAARALGDRSAESWILHEQGVRAMALGHYDEAEELLWQALGIRTDLGAGDEVELTRSQLAELLAARETTG